ncbi:alpha/beta fold hydrolase [Nakamurella endophytica]|uniref:alpha/beta fold hydrolase n=1 Tax=Nakamurella endophytica TaxID=1748367 RepID=UPI001E3BFDEE|nr:alpha/beta fold hydrolase [Nakamurella endophytica]
MTVQDADGVDRAFHVLDSAVGPDGAAVDAAAPRAATTGGTLLCVHGNPTWSYLWRRLVAAAPPGWRVVAPDQLGMGFSERPGQPRDLARRIDDLGRLTDALGITGPVVTVGHDWGGVVSLGWAVRHPDQLVSVVLCNTAVHQPETSPGPVLIRLAHRRWVNELTCRRTPLFVRAATSVNVPRPPKDIRDAYAEPYRAATRRAAVSDFVADIPFAAGHPSRPAVDAVAEGIRHLDVPALLLWGPRDPVFLEEHLADLRARLPHARLHRFERAGHLLPEDAPGYVTAVTRWVAELDVPGTPGPSGAAPEVADGAAAEMPDGGAAGTADTAPATRTADIAVATDAAPSTAADAAADPATGRPSLLDAVRARAGDDTAAVVEIGRGTVSWRELHRRIRDAAAVLRRAGVGPGRRVALLVPPSVDLVVAVYAVWWVGGSVVLADRGLGLAGIRRALRSTAADHVLGGRTALVAARALGLPGRRIHVEDLSGATSATGDGAPDREVDDPDLEAAVLFTSGATGPAKGVRYRHRQLRAQLELVRRVFDVRPGDAMVAAFAPFALYGPALGVPSAVPRIDVTAPATLTAPLLAEAVRAVDATTVFAAPAALRTVLATADGLTAAERVALAGVRVLTSAGAPVPAVLLRRLQALLPDATLHTPYGMTEALPVADIDLAGIEAAGPGDGVCVGRPVPGVRVQVSPLGPDGRPTAGLTDRPGVVGELCVQAEHVRDGYDALWLADRDGWAAPGWHRTGDVGVLDADGRIWVQGRTAHVIATETGPVTPVGIEQRITGAVSGAGGPADVAVVGVGPAGVQQVVAVVAGGRRGAGPLPDPDLVAAVRAAAGRPLAAVLRRPALPVDIRHQSKIDRVAVASWAGRVLAGG